MNVAMRHVRCNTLIYPAELRQCEITRAPRATHRTVGIVLLLHDCNARLGIAKCQRS